jgi:hypothetical protein
MEEEEIVYMEKPEWVTWEQIKECIYKGHESNREKGVVMLNTKLSPEELKKHVGNGHCFVALKGKEVVGTFSLKFLNLKKWWVWGKVAYPCLDGILPEYKGTDVYFGLNDLRMKYIEESGVRIIQNNTSEFNTLIRKLAKKKGFKTVMYTPSGKGADYYSVTHVKWLDGCPFSDKFIDFMFNLSKFIIPIIWRPDFSFRFWFKKKTE